MSHHDIKDAPEELPGLAVSGPERLSGLLQDVKYTYIDTSMEKEKKSLMKKVVSRLNIAKDKNKVRKYELEPSSKSILQSKRLPPLSNIQVDTKHIFVQKTNDQTISRKVPDKLVNSTEEAFSTLMCDSDRPDITQNLRDAKPTIVLLGQFANEPEPEIHSAQILNVRNIVIDTREKKEKKSFIQKLFPRLKSAKDDVKAKYEVDSKEYFEVKDIESKPPKKLKKSIRDRMISMIHTLI